MKERKGLAAVQNQERVLLIDDDLELCSMLDSYLSRHGWQVLTAFNGSDGIRRAHGESPDLIILDGMLPDMDGIDVLRTLRSGLAIPVLLLTARGDEVDRIVGLEMGADDYVGKPFNPRELLARMRAIARRTASRGESAAKSERQNPGFSLDEIRREIRFRGKAIVLTDIEYRLLKLLLQRTPEIVDREELTICAFERPSRPFDRSLDMHVSRLRKKLEGLDGFHGCIRSIRNSGYLLVQDIAEEREMAQ